MEPQVVAAIVAASVSVLTLIGTLAAQYFGRRATGKDTGKTLDRTFAEQREQLAKTLAEQRDQLAKTLAEQRTRTLNERFATAAGQLGSDKPSAVRLAGVYAMAGLADDWEENRQTCVDVLCAYLRLPYEPDPGEEAAGVQADRAARAEAAAQRLAFRASREVRHTVIRVITAHLSGDARDSWQGLNFDFTDVVFDGGDFRYAKFSGNVSFADAEFTGRVSFAGAEFSADTVDFSYAKFSGGEIDFDGAKFPGDVSFVFARFSGGTVNFGAEFTGGTVSFAGAEFSGGTVGFGEAKFSGGEIDFDRAEFPGDVSFWGAEFTGSDVHFGSAKFTRGTVDFSYAKFTGGEVRFTGAEFAGGTVRFGDAKFPLGEVGFEGARFTDGTVDFGDVDDWSHPPLFNWNGEPPTGVILPTGTDVTP
jgi:uncharacterized protein YjbI with pentapeptide repeats